MSYHSGNRNTPGIYHASSSSASDYYNCIADPISAPAAHIPDDNITPHILKTVNWNINVNILGASGLFVWPHHSMDQGIRMYGYDPVSQTNNLLQVLQPDEDLSLNFLRARPISSGATFLSSTVAAGAFAISGSFNGITYIVLPPIQDMNPSTVTQYAADGLNVVGSVSAAEGVVAVSPLYDNRAFRVFDTKFTPDHSADLQLFAEVPTGTVINTPGDTVTILSLAEQNLMPAPLPWGNVNTDGHLTISTSADPGMTTIQLDIEIVYLTANPTTYAKVENVEKYFATATWVQAPVGFWHAAFSWSVTQFHEEEISDIRFVLTDIPVVVSSVAIQDNFEPIVVFGDYYRKAVKEPGTIIGWQAFSTNPTQQLIIGGKSHWEVIPNASLIRNIGAYYTVDDPLKLEAAVHLLMNYMSTGEARFLYSRKMYELAGQRGTICKRVGEVEYEAASRLSSKFLSLIKKVGGAVAKPLIGFGGQLLGDAVGNPALGTMLSNAGLQLYNGVSGSSYRSATKTYVDGAVTVTVIKWINGVPTEVVITVDENTVMTASSGVTLAGVMSKLREGGPPAPTPVMEHTAEKVFNSIHIPALCQDPFILAKGQRLNGLGNTGVVKLMRERKPAGFPYTHAAIPLIIEQAAIGATVIFTTAPIQIHTGPSEGVILAYPNYITVGTRRIYIEDHIREYSAVEALLSAYPNSLLAEAETGPQPFYLSIIPTSMVLKPIEGFSYLAGLVSAWIGVPATALVSGTMTNSMSVDGIADKLGLAIHVNRRLYAFNVEAGELTSVISMVSGLNIGISTFSAFYGSGAHKSLLVAEVGEAKNFSTYVAMAVIDGVLGVTGEKMTGVASEEKVKSQAALEKRDRANNQDDYEVSVHGKTQRVTRKYLMEQAPYIQAEMESSGWFNAGNPGAANPMRWNDLVRAKEWAGAASYWAGWKSWHLSKTAPSKKKKKKGGLNTVVSRPGYQSTVPSGSASNIFARFARAENPSAVVVAHMPEPEASE